MPDWIITYSGYFLLIITTIIAFLKIRYESKERKKAEIELLKLKQEHEDKSALREKRYQTYKEYLSKLDSINDGLYSKQFNEDMMKEINETFESIVKNPDDLTKYFEIIKKQSQFLFDWMRDQNKLLEELNGFRLICSDEILSLIDEYTDLAHSALEATVEINSNMLASLPGKFDKELMKKYADKYDRLREIKKRIEELMRKEIGAS